MYGAAPILSGWEDALSFAMEYVGLVLLLGVSVKF